MSYQVLARKWRPRSFAEMVGQEHVVKALCNALDNDRVHHAFLFTGTRGVGKTSVARVLAKALNCEKRVSSKPCGECSACLEVDAGRFVDLIEVDAASRTGVDDTRDLLDNVQYRPARGRYKVYLIDEVHMFSKSSFNALLKTLEEPPPHVKFLLATTDPRKLPATVLSRCLQFNLRRLAPGAISRQLGFVLKSEGIEFDSGSLGLLAHAADGSLRDALSLLDQAIAFCGGGLRGEAVAEMLGTIDHSHVTGLLTCLVESDPLALLRLIEEIDALAPDYDQLLGDLLVLLQRIAIFQVAGQGADEHSADPEALRRFADVMAPEDVQLAYQIGLIGKRDLSLSPEARGGFEMVLLRMMYFSPATDDDGNDPDERTPARRSGVVSTDRSAVAGPASSKGASVPRSVAVANDARRGAVSPSAGLARRALDAALEPDSPAIRRSNGREPETSNDSFEESETERREPSPTISPDSDDGLGPPTSVGLGADRPGEGDKAVDGASMGAALEAGAPEFAPTAEPERWHRLFAELDLDGVARELAANCLLERCDGDLATLILDSRHSHLCTPGAQNRLNEALGRHFARPMRSHVRTSAEIGETPAQRAAQRRAERQRQAEQSIADDPNVRTLMDMFGARIRADSVTPNTDSGR